MITKDKVPTSEKADQKENEDYLKIIDPLTLEATTRLNEKPLAVNYTCSFEPTVTLENEETGEKTIGVWYSSPKGRGQEAAFMQVLKERKALSEDDPRHVSWEEEGFYFTQEQGEEAREAYEKMVIDGETTITVDGEKKTIPVKCNAKSWKNKHGKFSGTSLEELKELHPELYKTSSGYVKKADREEEQSSTETPDADQVAEEIVSEAEEISRSEPSDAEIEAEQEMTDEELESADITMEEDEIELEDADEEVEESEEQTQEA